jgi:hypothetical protein
LEPIVRGGCTALLRAAYRGHAAPPLRRLRIISCLLRNDISGISAVDRASCG